MNGKVSKNDCTTTTSSSIHQKSSGGCTNSQIQNSTVMATSIENKITKRLTLPIQRWINFETIKSTTFGKEENISHFLATH